MSKKLKPCPLPACGAKAVIKEVENSPVKMFENNCVQIQYTKCGCRVTAYLEDKDKLIKFWNTRV